MRALVTGAGGFVGHYLREHLEALGDDVATLDRTLDGVDVTDADGVRERITTVAPQVVYHLAALSHVGASWSSPALVFRVNAEGTLNVLRACRDGGVERVIVVGSGDEYGRVEPAELPLREDAPLRPLTPYGASKVAAEYLARQAFLGDGLPVIATRSFNHTGPGQPPRFVVSSIAWHIAEAERTGSREILVGSLDAVRDYSDVRDVVRAYRLLAEHGEPGEIYNVCAGECWSVAEVAQMLLRLTDRPLELVVDPDRVRPVDVPRLLGDNTKLVKATGYQREYTFDDTVRDVLDHWRTVLP